MNTLAFLLVGATVAAASTIIIIISLLRNAHPFMESLQLSVAKELRKRSLKFFERLQEYDKCFTEFDYYVHCGREVEMLRMIDPRMWRTIEDVDLGLLRSLFCNFEACITELLIFRTEGEKPNDSEYTMTYEEHKALRERFRGHRWLISLLPEAMPYDRVIDEEGKPRFYRPQNTLTS